MKTKVLNKQQRKIDFDKNLLNNQNYILSKWGKVKILSLFLWLKYLTIFWNRFITTLLFIMISWILGYYNFIFFGVIFSLFIGLFLLFIPLIFINTLIKIKDYSIDNILWIWKEEILDFLKLFGVFDFSNPIYNIKSFFLVDRSNKNFKENIFSMWLRTIIYIFFIFIVTIFVTILIYALYIFIVYWKTSGSSSNLAILFLPLLILFFFLFKNIYKFFIRIRFFNILLFPVYLLFIIPLYYLNKWRLYKYSIVKIKPSSELLKGFDFLNPYCAENKYYKIQQK